MFPDHNDISTWYKATYHGVEYLAVPDDVAYKYSQLAACDICAFSNSQSLVCQKMPCTTGNQERDNYHERSIYNNLWLTHEQLVILRMTGETPNDN